MLGTIVISITAFLLFLYCIIIIYYRKCFLRLKQFYSANNTSTNSFSIIIPARNEEKNIAKCLESVFENDYPERLFEVIVVDDYSTDKTVEIIKELQKRFSNLNLIELSKELKGKQFNSYKKKAIETGIQQAKADWIITTDADCITGKQWLQCFDKMISETDPVFIAAPVQLINTGSFVSIFQCLDFISLQGITAASVSAGFHSMCNGANLAYKKTSFYEVEGFRGIDKIASGDDMLLMHKISSKFPNKVSYLFSDNAIVQTKAMSDWKSFFNQRIRWASKADRYDDKKIFLVLLLVYLLNLFLFVTPFVAIFFPFLFLYWILMVIVKTLVELSFMFPVAAFFHSRKLLWWFPVMQIPHIIYTVIAGWFGKFGKYQWKGRSVK